MVDIIFHVFDTDKDGLLSPMEFFRVMLRKESSVGHPSKMDYHHDVEEAAAGAGEGGLRGLLNCYKQCSGKH